MFWSDTGGWGAMMVSASQFVGVDSNTTNTIGVLPAVYYTFTCSVPAWRYPISLSDQVYTG
jgi:hypothetical protein